jgi:serine/threonine protein kinase/tetratricopeptide (TPR) repeat protein
MRKTDDREDPIDAVLARYLRAADRDRAPPPHTLVALYPEWASELRAYFADADRLEAVAAPVRSVVLAGSSSRRPSRPPGGAMLGPYRLDEEVGRGGMGVVYRAWDTQLNRAVAVKTIHTPAGATPEAVARFRAEAVAVARLQHPNIVQVFETGEHDGQPYVALEYVPGGSLAQLLTGRPVRPADSAALVETLARAVHYAHRRGVIHRDLKPANLLIAECEMRNGESKADFNSEFRIPYSALVKITDFGLAKVLDSTEPLTETGAVLGTPTYMAPEQAHGRPTQIGPASDVYALGVLLYELLTGRPPFCGVTKLDTLRQVMNDLPAPPRRLVPDCPRDLDTICLRCLEKEPVRRYASADVLADELRRFLEGKPILARPVSSVGRGWRWCRRNPVLAVLMTALTVATGLLAVQWWRAEQNAADARGNAATAATNAAAADLANQHAQQRLVEAVEQRGRAEDRFRTAHNAVHDLVVQLSESKIGGIPQMQPVRKEFLERAVGFYEGFVRDHGDDATLQFELADLCFRSAQVNTEIGSKADALRLYGRAGELYAGLLREDPTNQRYLAEQGYILNNSGTLHNDLGDRPLAAAAYRDALAVYSRLADANPRDLGYRNSRAIGLYNLGTLESDSGEFDAALGHLREARTIRTDLVKGEPGSRLLGLRLTDVDYQIAMILTRHGERDQAVAAHAAVLRAREELAGRFPNQPDVHIALSLSYRVLGEQRSAAGKPDEAEAALKKSADALNAAGKLNPNITRLPVELAFTLHALAEVYRQAGKFEAALDVLQRARAIREQLTRMHPQSRVFKGDLAHTYQRIAVVHTQRDRKAEAREAYTVARDLWQDVVKTGPTTPHDRYDYSVVLHNLGMVMGEFGRFDEAIEHLRAATAINREVVDLVPDRPAYREGLAQKYAATAEVELKRGRAAEAVAAARERANLCPNDPAQLIGAARDAALAAELPDPDGRRAEYVRFAVETLRAAAVAGYKDADRLDRDRAFAPLRSDDMFRQLMTELRGPP